MDNKFSVYVISNGSADYYPDNTLSKFSVKLPFSFDLPISFNERWGISINSIGLSSKFTSDYAESNQMPLIIELLSYADHNLCPDDLDDPFNLAENCHVDRNKLNEILEDMTGNWHYDDKTVKNYRDDQNLVSQLNSWGENNVRSKSKLIYKKDVDTPIENSLIYNFFFNSLKNLKSLDTLIEKLKMSRLSIDKKCETNFTLQNDNDYKFERVFFFRQDFYHKSNITQNTNFIRETNMIEDANPSENYLFEGRTNAHLVNDTEITLNNTNYKILILNSEYTAINIEFKKFSENYLSIPNLIKIKCDNIKSQVFNNAHSKDMEVIKPEFSNHISHYFHEFENPLYIPLLNTSLRDLTFELTDEHNNRLKLSEGIPTLLQINFKRMSSRTKSFSIRLTPMINDNNNYVNKFTNILPSTLNLNENWRVGLKEITFPSNIKSLPTDDNSLEIELLNDFMEVIPFSNVKCKIINESFDQRSLLKSLNERTSMLNLLTFSITDNCLYVLSTEHCQLNFSFNLAKFLNLDMSELDTYEYQPSVIKVKTIKNVLTKIGDKINWTIFRPAYLMIYSDLVKPTLISSEYTNILRIVPVKNEEKELEYQSIEFKNVEFREISNNFINIIRTEIRSHSGELVQFNSPFLSIHLYFTNNPFNKDI